MKIVRFKNNVRPAVDHSFKIRKVLQTSLRHFDVLWEIATNEKTMGSKIYLQIFALNELPYNIQKTKISECDPFMSA